MCVWMSGLVMRPFYERQLRMYMLSLNLCLLVLIGCLPDLRSNDETCPWVLYPISSHLAAAQNIVSCRIAAG
jgi:hypothetical protein